jgi:pyroglutamyl-peptidase
MYRTELPRILVTGFTPFGGEAINPSMQIALALQDQEIAGHKVITGQLPTVFGDSIQALGVLLRKYRPVLVVCLGQAAGRTALAMERIAINVNDARIPDNAHQQPVDTPVVEGGPAAYFSTLPIKAMAQAARDAGAKAEISQSAGTFVCNHVFYGLMHSLHGKRALKEVRGGFIHVPYSPEQAARIAAKGELMPPSMPLEVMVTGLVAALTAAVAHKIDIQVAGGSLH